MLPKVLKISEVADALQLSRPMAYRMAQRGELPCVRIGRSVRVLEDDLAQWLRERSKAAPATARAPEQPVTSRDDGWLLRYIEEFEREEAERMKEAGDIAPARES